MGGDCQPSCPAPNGFFVYDPSLAGSAVLLAVFGLLAAIVASTGIKSRTPLISTTLCLGLVVEILGLVGRILLHTSPQDEGCFFLFLFGTVIGPTLICAADFIVLPQILGLHGEAISPLNPVVVGIVFYALIGVALIIELVGVLFAAYELNGVHRGAGGSIAAGGLGVQAVALLLFIGINFWFALGLNTPCREVHSTDRKIFRSPSFKRLVLAMEFAAILMFAYSIYRLIELAGGMNGVVFQTQPAFMIAGATVPLLAAILQTFFHPGTMFGTEWSTTTSRGFKRSRRPPPIEYSDVPEVHHRYDPNIRQQFSASSVGSPWTARYSVDPPSLPAGSPGLPAHPKATKALGSPGSLAQSMQSSPGFDTRFSAQHEYHATQPPTLVDHEELW